MTPKTLILLAAGAAALSLPAVASAQPGWGYSPDRYGPARYEAPRGDWYGDRDDRFSGYPEFRRVTQHIWREIDEAARDARLDRREVWALSDQLRRIELRERREFGEHGWRLPEPDRADIRDQFARLDRSVDQAREHW